MWLEEKAPAYLRRLHLWLLQQESGDPNPLMEGTDRQWVVEAIAARRFLDRHRKLCCKRLLSSQSTIQDFRKYVDRGILADVVEHTVPVQDDALRWMFEAQLSMEGGEELAAREITRLPELSRFRSSVIRVLLLRNRKFSRR